MNKILKKVSGCTKPQGNRTAERHAAPVVVPASRAIGPIVRLRLYVRAGGRCEFDGCNAYLLEHAVTFKAGNFGQTAHIVAFRPEGPRGRDTRPADINDDANLMLLCAGCHKIIDDRPDDYTVQALRECKRAHELRIKHLTSLGPAQKTAVLVVKAPVNGQPVAVPFDHLVEATAPRYPTRSEPEVVDLTTIADRGEGFTRVACDTIKEEVARFFGSGGEGRRAGHASIFALGPIPVLIYLGCQLTNKIPADLFQRHRDTENWTWKRGGRLARYTVRHLQSGTGKSEVALVVSLSGTIQVRDLPETVRRTATIYEITLADQPPRPTFLGRKQDLEGFRTAFQQAMGLIAQRHGRVSTVDLFPAIPAPVAVLCGRELLPKAHPTLRVWDYDKAKGGFTFQLEVN